MNYEGKLYGKTALGYFDTSYTAKDWDNMEARLKELEAENLALKQANGVEQSDGNCNITLVSNTKGKLFCGVGGGFCQYEGRDKVCMQNDECVNQVAK